MIEKIQKCFDSPIALAVLSGVKKGVTSEFSKVSVRPFSSADGIKYQFEYTVKNQVKHKNLSRNEYVGEIAELLENVFTQCVVYGAENDFHINHFGEKVIIKTMPPTKKVAVKAHNKKKEYILGEGEQIDFLMYLGVMTSDGKVVKAKYNKFRQINKYLELLKPSLDILPTDRPLKIVDFGCGKAYLTFALYYYVVKILGRKADITGLDLK